MLTMMPSLLDLVWADTDRKPRDADYAKLKTHIGERLLDELSRYVPDIRDAIDVMEVSTPLSYERYLKRQRGGFMGFEASPERFRARWLRAPTPIKGLLLSGQDVVSDGVIGTLTGGVVDASADLGEDLTRLIVKGELRS